MFWPKKAPLPQPGEFLDPSTATRMRMRTSTNSIRKHVTGRIFLRSEHFRFKLLPNDEHLLFKLVHINDRKLGEAQHREPLDLRFTGLRCLLNVTKNLLDGRFAPNNLRYLLNTMKALRDGRFVPMKKKSVAGGGAQL